MSMSPRLLRPRAGGGFDPRSIAGLQLWLDASDGASLFDADTGGSAVAANGTVGRWQDKSGNARHVTQGTANNRPARRAAVLNGKDGLEFDGSNDWLDHALSSAIAQPYAVFVVASHDTAGAAQSNIFDSSTAGVIGNFSTGSAFFNAGGISITAAGVFVAGAAAVFSAVANGASSVLRKNGSQLAAGNPGTNSSSGTFRIGATAANGFNPWDGKVFELLLYSGTLTAAATQQIDGYLSRKWGL